MRRQIVLSLEQALSLSHATQRFVHLGWRVIRIEATPKGNRLPGDPNRYVGKKGDREDRHAYFIGPNVGKESISLNLKTPEGREVLHRLVRSISVDIFASNTLPSRYSELGIDYESLSRLRPELIWIGLSAMGPSHPEVPGYDPALQALTGYMDLTGDPKGQPTLCGVPFIDLKGGDEVFAAACLGLAERSESGRGRRFDISMTQAALSWLVTSIPLLDLGYRPEEVRRNGNEHREFVPVNVYPTADGHVYLAIGSDGQWARLVEIPSFGSLDLPSRKTNEQRRVDRTQIHEEIARVTREFKTKDLVDLLVAAKLVAAPIQSVAELIEAEPVRELLLRTTNDAGESVRLPPPAVESDFLVSSDRHLSFAPRYGEHTCKILLEAGFDRSEIDGLMRVGAIA